MCGGMRRRGLAACEMMDHASVQFVHAHTPHRVPIDDVWPFYVLLETQSAVDQEERVEAFLEHCLERGVAADGTIAQNETQV